MEARRYFTAYCWAKLKYYLKSHANGKFILLQQLLCLKCLSKKKKLCKSKAPIINLCKSKHVVDVTHLENYWLVKQRNLLFTWVTN